MTMFTDAIFAIAITLLALDLPRPSSDADFRDLGGFLRDQTSSFAAFALAFLMLWSAWRGHHTLFDQVGRASQGLLVVHIPLLFFAVLLPYSTAVFGEAIDSTHQSSSAALAVGLFAGNEALLLLCLAVLTVLVLRQRLYRPGVDMARLRTDCWAGWGIALFWVATAVGAIWIPYVIPYLWFATPLVGYGVTRLAALLPGRHGHIAS
jgi:uncharacterized membrane protein